MKKQNTSSRLRRRLTLQQEVQASDGAGGYSKSWQDVAELWGEITSVGTGGWRELLAPDQLQSEVTHRILLRYRAGVTTAMRLLFEERAFNIRAIIDRGEIHETLELLVHEGVAT